MARDHHLGSAHHGIILDGGMIQDPGAVEHHGVGPDVGGGCDLGRRCYPAATVGMSAAGHVGQRPVDIRLYIVERPQELRPERPMAGIGFSLVDQTIQVGLEGRQLFAQWRDCCAHDIRFRGVARIRKLAQVLWMPFAIESNIRQFIIIGVSRQTVRGSGLAA